MRAQKVEDVQLEQLEPSNSSSQPGDLAPLLDNERMHSSSSGSSSRDASSTAELASAWGEETSERITASRATTAGEADDIPLLSLRNVQDADLCIYKVVSEKCSPTSPDLPLCRICLESEGKDLIAPCRCRGTQKYVHRSCLDHWRTAKEGFAFAHCTECRAEFFLRENIPADRWWRKLKFQIFVARDHIIIFVLVQLVVAALGFAVYTVYGDALREEFGYEYKPNAFLTTVVFLDVMVGILYGCFVAIICGQRITDRHYHILQKQELTQEFVVENLEELGADPHSKLQPQHVKELRNLGLL